MKNIFKKIFCIALGGLTTLGGLIGFQTNDNIVVEASEPTNYCKLNGYQYTGDSFKKDTSVVPSWGYDSAGNEDYSLNKSWTFIRDGERHEAYDVKQSGGVSAHGAFGGNYVENLYFICDSIDGYVTSFSAFCNSKNGHYKFSMSVDGTYFIENAVLGTIDDGKPIQTGYLIDANEKIGKPSGRIVISFTTDQPDVLYLGLMKVYYSTTASDLSNARKSFSTSESTHSQLSFAYTSNYGKRDTSTAKSTSGLYSIADQYFLGNSYSTDGLKGRVGIADDIVVKGNDIKNTTQNTWSVLLGVAQSSSYYLIVNNNTGKKLGYGGEEYAEGEKLSSDSLAYFISNDEEKAHWTIENDGNGLFSFKNIYYSKKDATNCYLTLIEGEGFGIGSKTDNAKFSHFSYHKDIAYEISNLSLAFGSYIPASVIANVNEVATTLDKTPEYGVAYKLENNTEYTYRPIRNGGAFVANGGDSVGIDETLEEAVNNNHYFQYRLVFTNIPQTKYGMKITAAAYMRINVTYACLNETTFSVGSIAKEYLTNENTKNLEEVVQHQAVLEYLASFDVSSAN